MAPTRKTRLAIIQRVIPHYRKKLFSEIFNQLTDTRLYFSTGIPGTKVYSYPEAHQLQSTVLLRCFSLDLGFITIFYQSCLLRNLFRYRPTLIISEGLSNPFSLLKVIIYKYLFAPHVNIAVWSLFSLPMDERKTSFCFQARSALALSVYRLFDYYIGYSTYSVEYLVKQRIPRSKIVLFQNLSSNLYSPLPILTSSSSPTDESLLASRLRYKYQSCIDHHLSDKTSIHIAVVGHLSRDKCIDTLLDNIRTNLHLYTANNLYFHFVGQGPLYPVLASSKNSDDRLCYKLHGPLPSKQTLSLVAACDVLLLPGRGGMVISEALSVLTPVVCFACDGSEYDLVINGKTGSIVPTKLTSDLILTPIIQSAIRECSALSIQTHLGSIPPLPNRVSSLLAFLCA